MKLISKLIIALTLLIFSTNSVWATDLNFGVDTSLELDPSLTIPVDPDDPLPKLPESKPYEFDKSIVPAKPEYSLGVDTDLSKSLTGTPEDTAQMAPYDPNSNGTGTIPSNLSETTFNVGKHLTLDNGEQPKKYFKDTENSPIVSFIIMILDFAITIMGTIAMILFIVAGFMFMLASGNQQAIDKAKEVVKYAVIGLIVAALSYVIVTFVQSIFVAD